MGVPVWLELMEKMSGVGVWGYGGAGRAGVQGE